MPSTTPETINDGKPYPAYFLVRTTGELVPLIAVDELPPGANIVGVPRSLALEDTTGMLNLGLQKSCGRFYETASGRATAAKSKKDSILASPPRTPHPTRTLVSQHAVAEAPAALHSRDSSDGSAKRPAASMPVQLCRHWCHYGVCKWGQQCRFRHVMPLSASGLEEVGLDTWPAWYRRLNPGYFTREVNNGVRSVGKTGRGRNCGGAGGNGGACCGVLHGPGILRSGREERLERLRGLARSSDTRERVVGRVRSEELGEQVIAKLRRIEKEKRIQDADDKRLGSTCNALIERAAAQGTQKWEDESSEEGDSEVGEAQTSESSATARVEEGKANGKLVDV